MGFLSALPAPAPANPNSAPPEGTTTFAVSFMGSNPNGTWSLYILDDSAGDTASTVSGGWSVAIDSTGGFVPEVPEPSSVTLVGLAMGLFAFRRRQKRS